ncbi:hypothetical protein GCM10010219_00400 [Streptomyces netropsis]|nr:hypothetical protein GCM10010219_00400 [Streptomyces netropsis]
MGADSPPPQAAVPSPAAPASAAPRSTVRREAGWLVMEAPTAELRRGRLDDTGTLSSACDVAGLAIPVGLAPPCHIGIGKDALS